MVTEVLVLVVCVLIISWCLKVFDVIWWTPKLIEKKLRKQGIYGHPYRLLYGNGNEMMKLAREAESKPLSLCHDIAARVNPFIHKLATTYNKKVFVAWYGTTPRVVILDPKLIREMLSEKFGEFLKPEINSTMKLFLTGLPNINRDKWAKHRRILSPAFHVEKLKCLLPSFSMCVEELIAKWDQVVGPGDTGEVDVAVEFEILTANVISRAAFGSSFEEGRMVFLLQKEQGKLFIKSHLSATFPWLRFLPTKVNKRMKQIHREVKVILKGVIEKREKAMQSESMEKDDLLGLLLKSNQNEIQKKNKTDDGMTTEDVIEECKLFYFAGQETTAALLIWTMVTLSIHKNWQERARKEVWQLIGKKNKPTYDDLSRLKIVTMILQEVLRLYTPTSFVRCTDKETNLGGLTFPAGVQFLMPLELIHRDTELWGEDALEFNPERFSDGISKASKGQISHFPFGWGPRLCIGQNFALLEVKLAVSRILQHFLFELSPTYIHAPRLVITLEPQYGAPIILHRI